MIFNKAKVVKFELYIHTSSANISVKMPKTLNNEKKIDDTEKAIDVIAKVHHRLLLRSLPHLSTLSLQPPHTLLLPLSSHGGGTVQ